MSKKKYGFRNLIATPPNLSFPNMRKRVSTILSSLLLLSLLNVSVGAQTGFKFVALSLANFSDQVLSSDNAVENKTTEAIAESTKSDNSTKATEQPAASSSDEKPAAKGFGRTATLLDNGSILLVGGEAGNIEIFDSISKTSSRVASLAVSRSSLTATKLGNGRVLIVGGTNGGINLDSVEIYDPSNGTISAGSSMKAARSGHTATTLSDGRLLIVGGNSKLNAELFNPTSNTFTRVKSSLNISRRGHSAVTLPDGRVLIVGGKNDSGELLNSAEIFNPQTNQFSSVEGEMSSTRENPVLRVLPDGKVQIIGGGETPSMEIFDSVSNTFGSSVNLPSDGTEYPSLFDQIMNSASRAAIVAKGTSTVESPQTSEAFVFGGSSNSAETFKMSPVTISTEANRYSPGEAIVVNGTGFQAFETVELCFYNFTTSTRTETPSFITQADENGAFRFDQFGADSETEGNFLIAAKGVISDKSGQTPIIRASANITQIGFNAVDQPASFTVGVANLLSKPIRIQTQNSSGSGEEVTSAGHSVTVRISSNSITGKFDDSNAGSFIDSTIDAVISTGSTNTIDLFYRDTTAGPVVFTATVIAKTGSGLSNLPVNSTSSLNKTVNKANSTTTLISSSNPSTFGTPVTFTATVAHATGGTGTPAGTVQFFDGPDSLGTSALVGGIATISTNALNVATHPITAAYSGDSNFNGSTTTLALSQVVSIADQTITFVQPTTPAAFNSTFMVAPTSDSLLAVSVAATGGCSISGGTVTMTSGTDDCVLTASQAGNANYNPATDVVRTVSASKIEQTITFVQPTTPAAFNSTFMVAPTSDSLLAVSVAATGGCSISGGTVTMTSGTDDCVLTASQAGNANYNPATDVVRTVSASKIEQTITFVQPTTPAAFNSTFMVAPTSDSLLAVSVAATGGCSISGGTVTMTSGTDDCVLTASQAGNANYNPATDVVRTVSASKIEQTITFVQPTTPAAFNSTFMVAPTSDSLLAVSVAATGGCSISGGTVTMTSGTDDCVLTASQAGNANYNPATDVVRTVSASKIEQTITFVQPTTPAAFNSTFMVAPTSDSLLAVSVAATGGCSISGGTVTMTSGTDDCVLTASQAGNANYNPATDVVRTVSASKIEQTITFVQPTTPAAFNSTFMVAPTSDSLLAVSVAATGGCSISGGTVTMTSGTDDCVLTASQAGNANYNPATDVVRTVSASKIEQTITFVQPTTPAAFNSTFMVAPTSDSLLAVSVAATGGCSISGGTVTMTSGTDDCVLTASQAGNANYNPATDVVRTVSASKIEQTITFVQPTTPAAFNSTFMVAPTSDSLLAVSVAATGGCSISGGTVTMTSGTDDCVLTASQAGNANYNPATDVVRTVSASKIEQTITFVQPTTPAAFNSTFMVAPTSDSLLAVSVAATGGCSISGGTVTMTSGTDDCVLTASQAGNANYNPATDVVRTVSASKIEQTITFVQPTTPAAFNSTFMVAPTSDSLLAVSVAATGGCSISGGTVTMTSGTDDCVLTASQAGNANYNPATDVVRTVSASKIEQTITFVQPTTPAAFNSTFMVAPTSDSLLAVSVAATGGCSISGGTVTMTSGTDDCVLTASQAGNANYNPATDVVRTVSASKIEQTITFVQPTTPAAFNSTFMVAPTSDSLLAVSVAATGGCSISGGTVTMTSGTDDCVLTASQAGNANYNPATDVVRTVSASKIEQTITFVQPTTPAAFNSTFMVAPTSDSLLAVSVAATGGCSISGGTVTMTSGTDDCVLTASQAGNANYNPATDVVRTVSASKIEQTITFVQPTTPAAFNSTFMVAPTSDSLLAVSVAATGGCSISGGTVTMTSGTDDCVLTASQAGDTNYNPATDVVRTVSASKIAQTITFVQPPNPINKVYGDAPFTLTANGGGSGNTVTFDSTTNAVCTVTGSTVTLSAPGSCSITASQAGSSNYNAAPNVSITIAVAPNTTPVNIFIPTPIAPSLIGSTLTVPVRVSQVNGHDIEGYTFKVSYDPNVLTLQSPAFDQTATMSSSFNITPSLSSGMITILGDSNGPVLLDGGTNTLLNLKFTVNPGLNSDCSDLTISNVLFNETVPSTIGSPVQACVISKMTGQVTYPNSVAFGSPTAIAVPGTVITPAPSLIPSLTGLTDSSGDYSLVGFTNVAHVVTPSRMSNLVENVDPTNGAISAQDVSRIRQHILGTLSPAFTPDQVFAADVTGDGSVTAFDVSRIRRYLLNQADPNVGSTGSWKFHNTDASPILPGINDPDRDYTAVQLEPDNPNQDYKAYLMGDVTGNWMPAAPVMAVPTEGTLESKGENQVRNVSSGVDSKLGAPVLVSLPTASHGSGAFDIPIVVDDVTGLNIEAFNFDVFYDNNVIQPQAIPADNAGTLSSGMNVSFVVVSPGRLRIIADSPMSLAGSGTLLKLKFTAVGSAGMSSPLSFAPFRFNEGIPTNSANTGSITILGPTAATVQVGGRVTNAGGRGVARARVSLADGTGAVRTVMSNSFGYYRFDNVQVGMTYVASVASKQFTFTPQTVNVSDGLTDLNFTALP